MVSMFEIDKASSRSFDSGLLSIAASSSSSMTSFPEIVGGGAAQIEIVRRLNRSTSFRISVVDIVLLRCLGPIRGLAGRPGLVELDESILP